MVLRYIGKWGRRSQKEGRPTSRILSSYMWWRRQQRVISGVKEREKEWCMMRIGPPRHARREKKRKERGRNLLNTSLGWSNYLTSFWSARTSWIRLFGFQRDNWRAIESNRHSCETSFSMNRLSKWEFTDTRTWSERREGVIPPECQAPNPDEHWEFVHQLV